MNLSGLLFAFDFRGGVEALAGLLGFPGDDGVIIFDTFIMNIASVDIEVYDLVDIIEICDLREDDKLILEINVICCSQMFMHVVSIWCSHSCFPRNSQDSSVL